MSSAETSILTNTDSKSFSGQCKPVGVVLCASCDRCRARKTKCDGKRPCSNCAAYLFKNNKIPILHEVCLNEVICIYSPTKRRGPVPGKTVRGAIKHNSEQMKHYTPQEKIIKHPRNDSPQPFVNVMDHDVDLLQKHLNIHKFQMDGMTSSSGSNELSFHLQRQLLIQQAQFMQSPFLTDPFSRRAGVTAVRETLVGDPGNFSSQAVDAQHQLNYLTELQTQHQNFKSFVPEISNSRMKKRVFRVDATQKDSVSKLLYLLDSSSQQGILLKGYYNLSINELFNLPRTKSEDEYCLANFFKSIPAVAKSALQAGHFSELALGALISGEIQLSLALSNAAVVKLRDFTEEYVSGSCIMEVAQAYFLHGIYRGYCGDFEKYFKYRGFCLNHLSELENIVGIEYLLSAISFHDTLMLMMYDGAEEKLPDMSYVIPPLCKRNGLPEAVSSLIAFDPNNQNLVQGAPIIFLNKKAPPLSRSLDALACSVRRCCDMAGKSSEILQNKQLMSATAKAVMHYEDEVCSRNMVVSAFSLLKVHESSSINQSTPIKSKTHHLIISLMDAFLESDHESGKESSAQNEYSGFSDSQVQSLLSVCNTIVEHPLILFSGGPVYHMVSNATILLCHFINGVTESTTVGMTVEEKGEHPNMVESTTQIMQKAFFEEVLDTFLAVRRTLNIHRRKLPNKLRCHSIPRPNVRNFIRFHKDGDKMIDLGSTIMCSCRGCQCFVLMACSPCVAAKRMVHVEHEEKLKKKISEKEGDGCEGVAIFDEFDMDDATLLDVFCQIIEKL